MTHFNQLTPAEAERLALLAEECGEVIQVIGKILRHGWDSRNPLLLDSLTNRQSLEKELGHLSVALALMYEANDSGSLARMIAHDEKLLTINQWLHHNEVITKEAK